MSFAKKSVVFAAFAVSMGIMYWTMTAQADPNPQDKQPAAEAFKPVLGIEHLMEGQAKLFKEIKDGFLDQKWKEAANSAWLLAEIANVNQYQNEDPKYKSFARKMSDECLTLAQALKKRDETTAKDSIKSVGQTCGACHDEFKKKH